WRRSGAAQTRLKRAATPEKASAPGNRGLNSETRKHGIVMEKIRILLVDDHTVVRQGLRVLLEAEPDITIVAEADTGRQAVQLARKHLPDVVVMDIAMPTLNGLEATRQIIKEVPTARVLALSSYSDDEYVQQLTEAGAAGYLLKQTAAADLIKAVRAARK